MSITFENRTDKPIDTCDIEWDLASGVLVKRTDDNLKNGDKVMYTLPCTPETIGHMYAICDEKYTVAFLYQNLKAKPSLMNYLSQFPNVRIYNWQRNYIDERETFLVFSEHKIYKRPAIGWI